MAKGTSRTFSYRAGVRIRDSVLACDATGGSDLIFLSHAELIDGNGGDGTGARRLPRARPAAREPRPPRAARALGGGRRAGAAPHPGGARRATPLPGGGAS